MHIHARALKYFDMIRRCGSIREAARRLHVASSSVNRQLLMLEDEIGAPLFERMPDGLKLTAAGEAFSHHVITVIQDEQRLVRVLDALKGIRRGEVSIVSAEGLNVAFLPAVLGKLIERYPALRITSRTAVADEAVRLVLQGDADAAFCFSLARDPQLQQVAQARFALGAVVAPGHPLAVRSHASFADCARHPLILHTPGLSTRLVLDPLIAHHRRPLRVLLETASFELAKNIAATGAGVTFQTRFGLERDLPEGRVAFLPLRASASLVTDLGLYIRSGRSTPPALDAFLRIATEELHRWSEAA